MASLLAQLALKAIRRRKTVMVRRKGMKMMTIFVMMIATFKMD
jgi:hypothetical protein